MLTWGQGGRSDSTEPPFKLGRAYARRKPLSRDPAIQPSHIESKAVSFVPASFLKPCCLRQDADPDVPILDQEAEYREIAVIDAKSRRLFVRACRVCRQTKGTSLMYRQL